MHLIETDRLFLRELTAADAGFILELLNEPSFIQNIADKNVRSLDDAVRYIETGPGASYCQHGYGLYLVGLRESDTPIGICGLVKRDYLEHADVGYAFLERFWAQGYAYESAAAVRDWAHGTLDLNQLLGITSPDNAASIRLLEKLGLRFVKMIRTPGSTEDTRLFSLSF
ncbi:GNAT family N-acetyltransferase [Neisseriaceae bacterium JH1-16]|nr:GNAT family N-acetyltransferase [Neisseriaceae bacterium JH1-16]